MLQMESASASLPPEGQVAAINGFEMYYEIHGEGSPLVLLHGTPSSGRGWQWLVADFSRHYRLIIPDLRGYGRSTNPTNEFTFRQAALDTFALLEALEIDQFKAAGVSAGALILLHMATQQPARVEAMVLIGAAPYIPELCRAWARRTPPNSEVWDWDELRKEHVHGDEQIRAILEIEHSYKDIYDDMNFTPPYLSTISAETLIVHGDRDELFPVSLALDMYESIPDSYLWVLPNGSHVPVRTSPERVEQFTHTALAFLRGDWEAQ